MSEKLNTLDVASLFGDATLMGAQTLLNEIRTRDPDATGTQIRKFFLETIIEDSIDLIDWRTGGKNDKDFIAGLLTWCVLGADYANNQESLNLVRLSEKIYFIALTDMYNRRESKINEESLSLLYNEPESTSYIFEKCVTKYFSLDQKED